LQSCDLIQRSLTEDCSCAPANRLGGTPLSTNWEQASYFSLCSSLFADEKKLTQRHTNSPHGKQPKIHKEKHGFGMMK